MEYSTERFILGKRDGIFLHGNGELGGKIPLVSS